MSNFSAPALTEGLRVLELAANATSPLHFEDICKFLSISRSSVSRVLKTLVLSGFLRQEEGKRGGYTLGFRSLTMLKAGSKSMHLIDNVNEILLDLCQETKASVQLALHDDQRDTINILATAIIETTPYVVGPGNEELTNNCHRHGGAKVILAFLDQSARQKILNKCTWHKKTEKTISTLKELQTELEKIKKNGYCVDEEQFAPLFFRVSVPIITDKKILSLTASWFAAKLTQKALKQTLEKIQNTQKLLQNLPL